ncbi:putative potassium channel, voltage-dependent, ERG [Rosa chinensis]|uniref:Putative potassium channel, voltage-dependent, ERG n=2 Tax=Rosa chinensis TaxID=74649 RepID=A0A2P6SJ62_ROSCH|nr:cyclic nucleotide-gated ion channel 1 isoform X1 [Rosa chinensis]PRQ58725.1 putative potassium channel, voltage-dependent, ERG [Rosa chinensis]
MEIERTSSDPQSSPISKMTRSQDEEDPAKSRCYMSISEKITRLLQCLFCSWFATCYDGVCTTIRVMLEILDNSWRKVRRNVTILRDNLWWKVDNLRWKVRRNVRILPDNLWWKVRSNIARWKVRSLWRNATSVISSWWDTIFVTSCVIAVSQDPLFFYIPTINEEEKCLEMDTKLMIVLLVLRSLTDIIFIWDIKSQNYKAAAIAKIWRAVATDFFAILPVPQVLIIVVLYRHQELGYLNVFLFIQYVPRIYRLSQSFDNLKRRRDTGLWVKVAFNFFLYILACHILGASWFFFSVQREMFCWRQTCVEQKTCRSNIKCNENSSRNVTKLDQLCPMNPPNSAIFDFGIFVNTLGTSRRTPINFSTKLSYSFWWGVRNISNFGTNLETSTYLGEVWFATLISVIGLLLFVYLIGNNVQTFMQMKTMKEEEEAKKMRQEAERIRQELLHQERRINSWMHRLNFPGFLREEVERKIKGKLQENKEANLANVLTLLSFMDSDLHRDVKWLMLENVAVIKDMGRRVLSEISELMEIVEYPENTLIVERAGPLDRMVVITEGTMGVYKTSTNPSPSAIIQGSFDQVNVYGQIQLVSWALSTNGNLDSLPISEETVKCHTKVEGFVLTASDLKKVLSKYGVIQDNDSDQDHVEISNSIEGESSSSMGSAILVATDQDHGEISNSIEGESSSSLRSAILVATTASRFRRRLRRAKPALHLDFDPSSYKGM